MSNENAAGTHAQSGPEKRKQIYKVQIDKTIYESVDPTPTGLQLLILAGKNPPSQFALYEKPKAGQPVRIPLEKQVDLREPGVERFVTLPLDQTEGRELRRQFSLPEEDMGWLARTGLPYELVAAQGILRVIVYDWCVPAGFNVDKVAANVRIETGYPDTQIDMAYFFPPLQRTNGAGIAAVSPDEFDGKVWQRWSRHRTPANPWRPSIDNLSTHFALIESWFARELAKA